MKLCGKVGTIEEVEKLVKESDILFLHDGDNHGMAKRREIQGEKFKSRLYQKHYPVRIGTFLIDVKLTFDYREGRGEFACRDDKVWLVASKIGGLDKLLGELTPFSTHYYGNVASLNRESIPSGERH